MWEECRSGNRGVDSAALKSVIRSRAWGRRACQGTWVKHIIASWVTVLALASILPEDAPGSSLCPPASRFAWLRIVPEWGLKTENEEEWRDWRSRCCWVRGDESEQSTIKDICMQINAPQSPPTYPWACQYITSMRDNLWYRGAGNQWAEIWMLSTLKKNSEPGYNESCWIS